MNLQNISLALLLCCPTLRAATITVDGSATYQTIDGFGVNANYRSWRGDELKPVLDALIDEAGMTLFRITFDNTDWEATNDNSDPALMNWAYYNSLYSSAQFIPLWDMVAYLNSRGITQGAFFNFMGPGPQWLGGNSLASGMEAEWAEMLTSLLVYARNSRGLQFQLLAPDNEPDISNEGIQITSASQYVSALGQLAQKLEANGLADVRLVGPDLSQSPTGFLPELLADPGVMAKVAHFGVHCYMEGAGGAYQFIANSPYPDRTLWVTEFNVWCSGCDSGQRGTYDWSYCRGTAEYLLSQLAENASAGIVWEAYDSYYLHGAGTWSYWGLFGVENQNAAVKTYKPRKNFYTLAQVSRFVRPGARRIGVGGSTLPFDHLLAFNHSGSGQVTLVGVNPSGSAAALSATLAALPDVPSLELYYTSATTNLAHGGRVAVSNGSFTTRIPANCVFALSGLSGISVTVTNPTDGAQFDAPAEIELGATATSAAGSVEVVEFYNGPTRLGESRVKPYAFRWSNVPMGDYVLSARATDTAGNAHTAAGIRVAVAGPVAEITVTPAQAEVPAGSTQLFSAVACDQSGHALALEPGAASWSVSGGRPIDETGLFTAGKLPGGPFHVIASSGGIRGTASVSVVTFHGGTVGNQAEGAWTDTMWENGPWINVSRFQATSNMVVSTMQAKVGAISGGYQCAIYAGDGALSFLRGTAEVRSPAKGWQEFPLSAPLALTNGQVYWLAVWSDDANARIYYSDASGTVDWGRYNYGAWPQPLLTTGGGNFNYCILAKGASSPTLTGIAIEPLGPTLVAGGSQQFRAIGIFSDGSTEDLTGQVTWSSSNPSIATVTTSGLTTALLPGATTISYGVGGLTNSGVVTVQAPRLAIAHTLEGAVILSWPAAATGWVLEESSAPGSTNWLPVPISTVRAGVEMQVALPLTGGVRYYRLVLESPSPRRSL